MTHPTSKVENKRGKVKKKLTAEQVAFRLYDALMSTCIRHDINPYNEPTIVDAFKEFSRLNGVKETQWEFVYEVVWNFIKETEQSGVSLRRHSND